MEIPVARVAPYLLAVITAAVALLAAAPPATADQAEGGSTAGILNPEPGRYYNLMNDRHGLKCLAGRYTGSVVIYDCHDNYWDQYWMLQPAPAAGYYRVVKTDTGRCLAMTGWSNGDKATAHPCVDSYYDQWWALEQSLGPTPSYRLRNYKTGKCLGVDSATGANGSQGVQWDCVLNWNDQWWHFHPR
ncbi:RICIN domain-containing protein [Micromonospora echinospora]